MKLLADVLRCIERDIDLAEVARARLQGRFAQGGAAAGGGIELLVILNHPAAGDELGVDLLAGALFGTQFRQGATELPFSPPQKYSSYGSVD